LSSPIGEKLQRKLKSRDEDFDMISDISDRTAVCTSARALFVVSG
jgi:hypothetical protein